MISLSGLPQKIATVWTYHPKVGVIMKEICPNCGFKFGFRGPRHKFEKYYHMLKFLKIPDNMIRYFCPSCSVELLYHESNVERIFRIIGFGGICLISVDQILRQLYFDFMPKVIALFFSVVGIFGMAIWTFLFAKNRHYKMKVLSQQVNAAGAKGGASD